jgi:hypothetical protein
MRKNIFRYEYFDTKSIQSNTNIKKFKKKLGIVQKINGIKITDRCVIKKLREKKKWTNNVNFYMMSNIIWGDIKEYPSEYFINIINNCKIIGDIIVNVPLFIENYKVSDFEKICLSRNILNILDGLFHQGSKKVYSDGDRFIFSEHAGALQITNKNISNIVVFTNTNRLDSNDNEIYLPNNSDDYNKYVYLFHTHPNTLTYAGRISEGIIYEFPSPNDIYNYIKYHNEGFALASIVVAPEGLYIIRQLRYSVKHSLPKIFFDRYQDYLVSIQNKAIDNLQKNINISDIAQADTFHKLVSNNLSHINRLNSLLSNQNLIIEYYPRVKKNNNWILDDVNLLYYELK